MGRKRKTKKKPQQNNYSKQALNRFKNGLYSALKLIGQADHFHLIKEIEFLIMRTILIKIPRPVAKSGHKVTSRELQKVHDSIQNYSRTRCINFADTEISGWEYAYIYAFVYTRDKLTNCPERQAFLKEKFLIEIDLDDQHADITTTFQYAFYKMIIILSNPRHKYYSYDLHYVDPTPKNPSMELMSVVSTYPAQSKMLSIQGKYRPAFRLAKPVVDMGIEYLSVSSDLVGHHHKGSKCQLDLYIQSHALNRFQERLNVLEEDELNYCLWLNTANIIAFEFYKSYLLLPVKIYDKTIGYFFVNVIGDKLVLRTFLFITHSCTPEGDRLKELSGLQKNDIKYWHVDRLSAIIGIDEHPQLEELFKAVGVSELLEFKTCFFEREAMAYNDIQGFVAYMEQGKKELEEADLTACEQSVKIQTDRY